MSRKMPISSVAGYCFKVAPLSKKVYVKYKDVCKVLEINSHEATELAFNVLWDSLQGDYDKVKLRLGQYVGSNYPTPAKPKEPNRKPDFVVPAPQSGEPDFLNEDYLKTYMTSLVGEALDYYEHQPDGSVNVYLKT